MENWILDIQVDILTHCFDCFVVSFVCIWLLEREKRRKTIRHICEIENNDLTFHSVISFFQGEIMNKIGCFSGRDLQNNIGFTKGHH